MDVLAALTNFRPKTICICTFGSLTMSSSKFERIRQLRAACSIGGGPAGTGGGGGGGGVGC